MAIVFDVAAMIDAAQIMADMHVICIEGDMLLLSLKWIECRTSSGSKMKKGQKKGRNGRADDSPAELLHYWYYPLSW